MNFMFSLTLVSFQPFFFYYPFSIQCYTSDPYEQLPPQRLTSSFCTVGQFLLPVNGQKTCKNVCHGCARKDQPLHGLCKPKYCLEDAVTLSLFSISLQLPDLILRPYISTSPALLILFGFASVVFKDVSSQFLCWEIAISAFYASLGCSALPGQEEARQEAAIPPLSLPVLPSTSATDHDGHSLGKHKKPNPQSLSAHLTIYQGSRFASLQSSICRLNPIHAPLV